MALQKDVEFKTVERIETTTKTNVLGTTTRRLNCYIKVEGLSGNKDLIYVSLGYYDMSDRNILYDEKTFTFTPSVEVNATNYHHQAYEYLKTLDEFVGAIDC